MAELVYTGISSLDGYVADADGNFDWSAPDPEVHAHVNDLERSIGTYLYGRRLYEVMAAWQTIPADDSQPPAVADYARIWRAADKIIYSTTLDITFTERTRLERAFDVDAVRQLKETAPAGLSVGGPTLAAQAIRAGLVDELRLYQCPLVVGGGTPALPDRVHLDLELTEEHRFGSGVVFVRYRVRP